MSVRILVVDDNPSNLKLVCDVLECEQYEVERAADAEEALVKIENSSMDLILTDIGLPGMDGLGLTRLLKSQEKTKHIPVIALTAFAMKGDDLKAYEAGCDGYITKPVDTRQLVTQVREFLAKSEKIRPDTEPQRLKIMVVEDKPAHLKLLHMVLVHEGHKIFVAETAEAAFQAIQVDKPDVLLLDLALPGINGLELARLLKQNPNTVSIPIIAITAFPDDFDRQQALDAGCDAYIVKPIDTRVIGKMARSFVHEQSETE